MKELLAVLRKANKRGEVGYAFGGKNEDLPLVMECERRGWIVYAYDASPGPDGLHYGQKRSVYLVTTAGRKALLEDG